MGLTRYVNGWTLRQARVHLDVYAMLLFRRFWLEVPNDVDIYLYCDSSSSSTKGTELFGVSFELFDYYSRIPCVRRYMPFIALQRDFLDAAGKAYALLWCVWLLVGPTIAEMARFCNQVKGLVTDMGTERLLPRMIDILDLFYEIMLGRPNLCINSVHHCFLRA